MDIIIFGLARWDGEYSSTTLSLAKALSTHHRVFYVDNPFTVFSIARDWKKDIVQRRKKPLLTGKDSVGNPFPDCPNLFAVTPPVMLPINMLNPGGLYRNLYAWNNRKIQRFLQKLVQSYGIKKPVYLNIFNPLYAPVLAKKANPALNIYYTVDAIEESEYIKKHGPRLENEAIKQADFALATSKQLQRAKSHLNTVHYLPNAADISLFSTAHTQDLPKPVELQGLKGEVILYTGNIMIREDFDLLEKIATAYPHRHLVLVGPINTKNNEENPLTKLPNVIFTGGKKLEELPAYLQHSHCAIIPFICNKLTAGIYPLKINEYLASGTPVVSTPFSEDIRSFEDVIYLGENHGDFVQKIDLAIRENSKELAQQRIQFAAHNNWENRANQLNAIIQEHLPK